VSHNFVVLDGDKRNDYHASAPQPVHNLRFIVSAESDPIHFPEGIVVGGDLLTDQSHDVPHNCTRQGREFFEARRSRH